MAASIPAGSLGNHDRFPIWRTPYYRLGRSGWTPYGCTCLRYEEREEEPYRVCMYPSTNQRQPAGSWSSYRKKRSLETREELWGGRGDGGGRESEGGYWREAGARAYDIKHYNYYLNSSRMAPGVAALSSSSFPFAHHTSFSRSVSLHRGLHPPSCAFHFPPPPLFPRAVVWPHSHALFALVYRSPLVDRSFCFFEVALLLLRPRVGATLSGLVPVRASRPRRERTVATIDPIL